MAKAHILVVDDEPDIRQLIAEILEDEGYQVETAENGNQALKKAESIAFDLVLLDIWMPDLDGISVLKTWHEKGETSFRVVMISGHGTIETAVEATRLGAYDFIEKPVGLAKLLITVEHALESVRLSQENQHLRHALQYQSHLVGQSQSVQDLLEQAKKLSQHNPWVLISGESGTGKEMLARHIHSLSEANQSPFVVMSVGVITPENALIELFGAEKSGEIIPGKLEQASGGTLFIDELAELEPEIQRRLSSALENGSFLRQGGSQAVNINVRMITASSQDLDQSLESGDLRKDLYYQLNVVPVSIPPLRDRPEDIPELLTHFTDLFTSRDQLPYRHFSFAAQNRLRSHSWPGNVRELKNLVQRLLLRSDHEEISLEEIEVHLQAVSQQDAEPGMAKAAISLNLPLKKAREQFERQYLVEQLRRMNGSVGKVAGLSGLERTHLYRKLKALDIDPKNP